MSNTVFGCCLPPTGFNFSHCGRHDHGNRKLSELWILHSLRFGSVFTELAGSHRVRSSIQLKFWHDGYPAHCTTYSVGTSTTAATVRHTSLPGQALIRLCNRHVLSTAKGSEGSLYPHHPGPKPVTCVMSGEGLPSLTSLCGTARASMKMNG